MSIRKQEYNEAIVEQVFEVRIRNHFGNYFVTSEEIEALLRRRNVPTVSVRVIDKTPPPPIKVGSTVSETQFPGMIAGTVLWVNDMLGYALVSWPGVKEPHVHTLAELRPSVTRL